MTPHANNLRKRLLQGLLPGLRLLPPRLASRVVARLGQAEFWLHPAMRHSVIDAVEQAAGRIEADWNARTTARRLIGNTLRWHARDKLLDGLTDRQVATVLEVHGQEHLDQAYRANRGVVLLFNHFGPFLMPAHWLVRQGYPLRWFTERPRHISKLVARTFSTEGPLGQRDLFISRHLTPSEGGAAIRKAVRMLQAGMIVQLAGDVRWSGVRCAPGRFLGRDYHFTTTWVSLAGRTGAPVVPAFAVMNRDGTYRIEFLPPLDVPREAAGCPEVATRWVQHNLSTIEEWVRRFPENSGDYFFWNEQPAQTAVPAAA